MHLLTILIPAIIYCLIIYISAPYKSINLENSTKYLGFGLLSPLIVLLLNIIYPGLHEYYFLDFNLPIQYFDGTWGFEPTLFGKFIMNFFQVASVEELAKFAVFYAIYRSDKNLNPIQVMFNVILVSTGFAILENFIYYMRNPHVDVIFMRTFTALIVHIMLGCVCGYFIARSRMEYKPKELTNFSYWLTNNDSYREKLYIFFGLVSAIIFHGIYDYDLTIQTGYSPLIIVTGLFGCWYLFKNLKNRIL